MDNSDNILNFTYEDLIRFLHKCHGKGRFHAAAVYREVFKNGNTDFSKAKEFKNSPEPAKVLSKSLSFKLSPIIAEKNRTASQNS